MKKIFSLIIISILIIATCFAESAEDKKIIGLMNKNEFNNIAQICFWGNAAACVASKNDIKYLCIFEKKNNEWHISIANPKVLIQKEDYPSLYLDSDQALFWSYNKISFNFVASRKDIYTSRWIVDLFAYNEHTDKKVSEYCFTWSDEDNGKILYTKQIDDENDNILMTEEEYEILVPWLREYITLDKFDIDKYLIAPYNFIDFNQWNMKFISSAAKYYLPENKLLFGQFCNGNFHFYMQKPNNDKVYIVSKYIKDQEKYEFIESTPMPENSFYGSYNTSAYVYFNQQHPNSDSEYVALIDYYSINDSYGVVHSGNGQLQFGENFVYSAMDRLYCFGNHPWKDITKIDWNTIPLTVDDASRFMNAEGIAVVNNPWGEDRLNLRTEPNVLSKSLGKYYNGTLVKINYTKDDWVNVSIGNRTGWMMKKYLIIGEKNKPIISKVSFMPHLDPVNEITKFYTLPNSDYVLKNDLGYWNMLIIGVYGDEWYHVWLPLKNEYGYIKRSDLWEGNG